MDVRRAAPKVREVDLRALASALGAGCQWGPGDPQSAKQEFLERLRAAASPELELVGRSLTLLCLSPTTLQVVAPPLPNLSALSHWPILTQSQQGREVLLNLRWEWGAGAEMTNHPLSGTDLCFLPNLLMELEPRDITPSTKSCYHTTCRVHTKPRIENSLGRNCF